ncbi:hypothetical protein A2X44_02375 [candidate division CPR3 bacterium GWF2_35_18]|uniref:Thermitase n=1 Tax=candidate division CPR3 bacterium GW2011_GWF2_35_18 TaxID=1618350 RepID=A0A0G0BKR1_UNCC3|nr:MAG: Thermitase [candidate division CPR3 bacterium GW2011_GWF2_35_18]OGB62841.1 MAG: hypothetical protein A2X44_02375 [candidate division CPR3 bacterium GWF2_35_18]OGB65422.1 MAG: hypothetical protein A2250_00590 [candidate division CPR3 bacterium RIFOXYA2_FULL_35_13]
MNPTKFINILLILAVLLGNLSSSAQASAPQQYQPNSYQPQILADGTVCEEKLNQENINGETFTTFGRNPAIDDDQWDQCLALIRGDTPAAEPTSTEYVLGHVIVQASNTVLRVEDLPQIQSAKILTSNVTLLQVQEGQEETLVAELKRKGYSAALDYIRPVDIMTVVTPNDPIYQEQWNLQQLQLPRIWETITGTVDVTIGFVDTGIAWDHEDLAANVVAYTTTLSYGDPYDDNGHGTLMSGISGAVGNNGLGVTGFNWSTNLFMAKACDNVGCSDSDVIQGMQWLVDQGVSVASISLGSTWFSQPLCNQVSATLDAGVAMYFSAGNSGLDELHYPAACDSRGVVVGATANKYSIDRAYYSTWGYDGNFVMAPGGDHQSGDPNWDRLIVGPVPGNEYAGVTGTSPATPQVAALAAMLIEQDPSRTIADVTMVITSTVKDLGEPGFDPATGYGQIDPCRAVLGAGCDTAPWVSGATPDQWLTPAGGTIEIGAYIRDDHQIVTATLEVWLNRVLSETYPLSGTDWMSTTIQLPMNVFTNTALYTTTITAVDDAGQEVESWGPQIVVSTNVTESQWPQAQRDAAHTGYSESEIDPSSIQLLWSERTGGANVDATPALAYMPDGRAILIIGDATRTVSSGPSCKQGPFGGGTTYAVDALTGTPVWTVSCTTGHDIGIFADRTPVINGTLAYFGDNYGWAYTIDYVMAAHPDKFPNPIIWQRRDLEEYDAAMTMTMADNLLYVPVRNSGLYALDPLTGETVWHYNDGRHIFDFAPSVKDGILYVTTDCSGCNGAVLALNSQTGELIWEDDGDFYSVMGDMPLLYGNSVFTADGLGRVYRLDALNGQVIWTYDANDTISDNMAITPEGYILVPVDHYNDDPRQVALDLNGNEVWIMYTDVYGGANAPICTGHTCSDLSYFSHFHLFNSTDGQINFDSGELDPGGSASSPIFWKDGETGYFAGLTKNGYTHVWSVDLIGTVPPPVEPSTNLTVTMDVTPTEVFVGDSAVYTITVTNLAIGTIATGVVLTDALPAGLQFDSWLVQNGAEEISGTINWTGFLSVEQSITFSFATTAITTDTLTNTVTVTATNADPVSAEAVLHVLEKPTPDYDQIFLPIILKEH